MLPEVSIVLGGAAAGKSRFGERLAALAGEARLYIATAEPRDTEMQAKIARHRARRGPEWATAEAPYDVVGALGAARNFQVVLIDCATLWLTNQLVAENDLPAQTYALIDAVRACPTPVVIVSNEVGQGIVPEAALSRRFREAQGRLNQRLAAEADLVVMVTAGLPRALKGALPPPLA